MFYRVIGWLSILIATLLLALSLVPGAMSIIASYLALITLIASIVSCKSGSDFYFKSTAIITAIGIFIVNDGLRVVGSLPQTPLMYKLAVYGFFITTCLLARRYVRKRI